MPPRPRVLLADDHVRLREALRDLLVETGFEVVAESGDGADAVAMASSSSPTSWSSTCACRCSTASTRPG
jgi:DNA-binding NarL/FixJ family response regulator